MHEKPDATAIENEQEISLLDVLNFLGRYKKTILGVAFIAGTLAAVVAMRMPNVYTARIKIIPPAQVQLIQSVLESERFKANLAQQYNSNGGKNEARGQSTMIARIKAGKEGVMEVEVDDVDPKRAAALANAYSEELDKFIVSMGLTDAARQRNKIELRIKNLQGRLDIENKKLKDAEKKLPVNMLAGEKEKRENIAQLRAQLDFILEVDAVNPKIMPSLDRLREQLDHQSQSTSIEIIRTISRVDQDYLEEFEQARYLEASVELLQNREALLKLDEQINKTRVLDMATVPERKSKPRRLLIVGTTMLAAAFLTILLMLLKEWFVSVRKQEHQAAPA